MAIRHSLWTRLVMVGVEDVADLPGGLSQCQLPPQLFVSCLYVPQRSVLLTAPPAIIKVYFYLIIISLVVGLMGTFTDALLKPQS